MTAQMQDNQQEVVQNTVSDKELNFRKLEAKYQRELEQERSKAADLERRYEESRRYSDPQHDEDDEDDSEPYVDKKKLKKTLSKFGEQAKQQTQSDIQRAVQAALQDERKQNWLKSNPDFYNILNTHAEKLALKAPDLAEAILEMPDSFERQKLVYKNIKALGLDQPEIKQPTIQDKIDANRKGPYYQPTGVGSSPYSSQSDFSPQGQKQAYDKMQELKNRIRL